MREPRRLGSTPVHPGPTFANDHPALERAWHPVALAADVTDDATEVDLLGRRWVLRREAPGATVRADPDPDGRVSEHLGVVWLAPAPVAKPLTELIACPQFDDPAFAWAWLAPARTTAAASLLADNFLDIAHFPFVHAGTFGSAEDAEVPAYDVEVASDVEFSYSYTHGYRNEEDPGVAAGLRPLRQTRRVACRYRLPFQMVLTLEHVESGGTTVVLFFLQPEHRRSTVAYTCVMRDHMGGAPVDLAAAVAFEHAVLMEDLALQEQIDLAGLPLERATEVHVRADRAGLELRRALHRFAGTRAAAMSA